MEVHQVDPEAITNEHTKIASGYLRSTIVEGLNDISIGALAEFDTQFTQFHGSYQQEDRDMPDEGLAQGRSWCMCKRS